MYRASHKKFRDKGNWQKQVTKLDESWYHVIFVDIEMQLIFQKKGFDPSILDSFTPSEDNRMGKITQSILGPTPVPNAGDIEVYRRTLILLGIGKGVEGIALKNEILTITGVNEADFILTYSSGDDNAKVICATFEIMQAMEPKLKNEKDKKCFKRIQVY